jgi:hypothetical protein
MYTVSRHGRARDGTGRNNEVQQQQAEALSQTVLIPVVHTPTYIKTAAIRDL